MSGKRKLITVRHKDGHEHNTFRPEDYDDNWKVIGPYKKPRPTAEVRRKARVHAMPRHELYDELKAMIDKLESRVRKLENAKRA